MLDLLQKWGEANFNPLPSGILDFDAILSLLHVLRQWRYPVRLLKVKVILDSIVTGCLMHERADELA